ncbi:MAG: 3-isopropylmalate dehydrogenase [Pseudomonadota bacterium]
MSASIVALAGDGIGPEVMAVATDVLRAIAQHANFAFDLQPALIGGAAIDATGEPLPAATRELCMKADAVLLGAVGGPQWQSVNIAQRPEGGLLQLRELLAVFANLRPVRTHPALYDASPLKNDRLHGVDIMVVRELTGGIYFGDKREGDETASDACVYTRKEVARVVRIAADLAVRRNGKLTSVDKSNVLATSRLWRRVTDAIVADEFPTLTLEHLLVDAAAMHLLARPDRFDVMVTENMFGDILTDEASMLAGSLGLLPSASLGERQSEFGTIGLYEPIHGSAPDIAGKGIANPCGMLASIAMMLRYSLGQPDLADQLDGAIEQALADGCRTADIATQGDAMGTTAMGEAVIARL